MCLRQQARSFMADIARQRLDRWIADEAGAKAASGENERRNRKERPRQGR